MHTPPNTTGDVTLAGVLATSPAWAPWLDSINGLLTTATLVIGIVIGLMRLWVYWRGDTGGKGN